MVRGFINVDKPQGMTSFDVVRCGTFLVDKIVFVEQNPP